MIDLLISLAQDNPVLFGIIVFNVFAVGYLLVYFSLYIYKRRHPEVMLNILLWKTFVRKTQPCSTIEELYAAVVERLRKERILSKKDGVGMLARGKSMIAVSDEKRDLLNDVYVLYERKIYGTGPIDDEKGAVRDLFGRLLSV